MTVKAKGAAPFCRDYEADSLMIWRGVDVPDETGDDYAIIANAAIVVKLDLP